MSTVEDLALEESLTGQIEHMESQKLKVKALTERLGKDVLEGTRQIKKSEEAIKNMRSSQVISLSEFLDTMVEIEMLQTILLKDKKTLGLANKNLKEVEDSLKHAKMLLDAVRKRNSNYGKVIKMSEYK
jgi:ribosome-binding ATPase YchF (GTP1/OBG family)